MRVLLLAAVTLAVPAIASDWRYEGVDRIVAVSDIHGAYAAFERTLLQAGILDANRAWAAGPAHLVINGDLSDGGADSRAAMDLVMRLEGESAAAGGRVHVLLGEQDVMNLVSDKVEFAGDSKYGRWLLEKPLLVVIDDTAFAHAGLSLSTAEAGLESMNDYTKSDLIRYLEAPDSPLLYRSNVICPAPVEVHRLDAALALIGAKRLVVGHTPTTGRKVLSRFGGKLIEIDTGMRHASDEDSGHALIIEGDSTLAIAERGRGPFRTTPHSRRVGQRKGPIDDDELEQILREGDIMAREALSDGLARIRLRGPTGPIDALFRPFSRGRRFAPELAAYRLDRYLELDMVPVTVARILDGAGGTLQFVPASTMTDAERVKRGLGESAGCPMEDQLIAMRIFDALIDHPGRSPAHMLFDQDTLLLMLTGHDDAFGQGRTGAADVTTGALPPGSLWRTKLAELSESRIGELFDGVLDRRRQLALRARIKALEDALP